MVALIASILSAESIVAPVVVKPLTISNSASTKDGIAPLSISGTVLITEA